MPRPFLSPYRLLIPTLAVCLVGGSQLSAQSFFAVDPRGSYLRTSADSPASPLFVPLASFGGASALSLKPEGILQVAGSGSPSLDAVFCGVFSTTTELLGVDLLQRLPGSLASDASVESPCRTGNTFRGGLPTDILEDFFLPFAGLEVGVPTGAAYLVIAVPDDFYADNVSPDPSRYGVRVTAVSRPPMPVPEPTGGVLLLAGVVAILVFPRRAHRSGARL